MLMLADMVKKEIANVVRKTCTERRKISLLKDVRIRKLFDEKVVELVDVGVTNLWRHYKAGFCRSSDEVYGLKWGGRSK